MAARSKTRESLALLKILALSTESIKKGRSKPVKRVFADIRRRIGDKQFICLSRRDAEVFFKALENPPAPSARLKKAVAAYKHSSLNAQVRAVKSSAQLRRVRPR